MQGNIACVLRWFEIVGPSQLWCEQTGHRRGIIIEA